MTLPQPIPVNPSTSSGISESCPGVGSNPPHLDKPAEMGGWPLIVYYVSLLILVAVSVAAVSHVGFLLGWLTGASKSPVVPVVAPLVFGLLAILGVGATQAKKFGKKTGDKNDLHSSSRDQNAIWRGIFIAILTFVFCARCFYGVTKGSFERAGQYRKISYLLGDAAWDHADDDTIAELYKFRLQARHNELSPADFEPIIRDLVKPILEDDQPDKSARIRKALETIQSAFVAPANKS